MVYCFVQQYYLQHKRAVEDTRHSHMWLKKCDDIIASRWVGGQPQCAPVDNLAVWQLLV